MASVAAINSLSGHAHNPRGNLWFNDESTYGHKLLMKMGWNKGKGLGKNENGIKENLKVKVRNTNSGLGFKDDSYTNVMKTEYESILKNLAAEYSYPETTNSIKMSGSSEKEHVQKSKVVKSKLRYPKLFFGKDVTKYSEKDMKSIFICSTPLKSIEDQTEKPITSDKNSSENEQPKSFDTFSSSLSISDYFAKKMEEKTRNTSKNLNNTIIHQQTSLEPENSNSTAVICKEDVAFKKKQRDSVVGKEKSETDHLNEIIAENELSEDFTLSSKKSSKKRKKKSESCIEDDEINENKPIVCNITEENKLDKSIGNDILHDNEICVSDTVINHNSCRPNKKRKRSQAFENNSVESIENELSTETGLSLSPSKKKKKKNKIYSTTIQLFPENSVSTNYSPIEIHEEKNHISPEQIETRCLNNESKKRKKSKKKLKEKLKSCLKKKHGSYSLKNISFNETVSYRIIDCDTESVEPLASGNNSDEDTLLDELTDNDENNTIEKADLVENITTGEINSNDDISAKQQSDVSEDSDKELKLTDLPSSKSSHYNAWVESQRQAIKMQLYKKMLKSIKNHKILKTTNLLSIKGYGNWGFK